MGGTESPILPMPGGLSSFTPGCSAAILGKLERAELVFFEGLEGCRAAGVQGGVTLTGV